MSSEVYTWILCVVFGFCSWVGIDPASSPFLLRYGPSDRECHFVEMVFISPGKYWEALCFWVRAKNFIKEIYGKSICVYACIKENANDWAYLIREISAFFFQMLFFLHQFEIFYSVFITTVESQRGGFCCCTSLILGTQVKVEGEKRLQK